MDLIFKKKNEMVSGKSGKRGEMKVENMSNSKFKCDKFWLKQNELIERLIVYYFNLLQVKSILK